MIYTYKFGENPSLSHSVFLGCTLGRVGGFNIVGGLVSMGFKAVGEDSSGDFKESLNDLGFLGTGGP